MKISVVSLSALALLALSAHASEELMSKGGCVGCHRVNEKLIGPSFKSVAEKYRSNRDEALIRLQAEVRDGSEGVWGDVPMAPTSVQKISDADLGKLIEWILQQ